jgi:hypothetical protein
MQVIQSSLGSDAGHSIKRSFKNIFNLTAYVCVVAVMSMSLSMQGYKLLHL